MLEQDYVYQSFLQLDMRVGTVLSCRENKGLRNKAYILEIDFGPLGIKLSSAQLTSSYSSSELVGKQIIAVCNFSKKKIGQIWSEVLVLGLVNEGHSKVVLLSPASSVENGLKVL